MSDPQNDPQQPPVPLIARFEELFSETGIEIDGEQSHLILLATDSHIEPPPPNPGKPRASKGIGLYYEILEHTAIGDNVLLRQDTTTPPRPASKVPLHLPNGLALTYGQILGLGGDFYGIPEQPICDGATAAERLQRFTAAFNSLATASSAKAEAGKILEVAKQEAAAVEQAIHEGKPAHEAYEKLGDTLSEEWNKITGGGSFVSALFPLGRYLKLAANNPDHFGKWAKRAYIAGHSAALKQAVAAHGTQDTAALELAYAMNAFADHFLTDLFASGHLRVPRRELAAVVTPGDLGSLISRFMHDEDNQFGLKVRNSLSEHWRTFGDKRYFDLIPDEEQFANQSHVKQATQASADEVFDAYLSGKRPDESDFAALKHLPDLDDVHKVENNFSPLFRVQGNKVLRRKDVNNLNDTATVDDWWGWSTYLLLKDYHPAGNTN
ncbi:MULTISPECIES: phospholipase [unclassified Pseudomonas]|uniref:phospholipase n=1 Tax=unclassified Pseudomonas TaxID=196821 RepID=UPI00191F400A|nr:MULTISPECIES: phospholipase [unclassified Pseudomonas]MBL0797158.1 phospholipase [Pseudomonas sp. B7]